MSIYSGFATRQAQRKYNRLIIKLLKTVQNHLIELFQQFDAKFSPEKSAQYSQIISRMQAYQQHKYLQPKFSQFLKPILSMSLGGGSKDKQGENVSKCSGAQSQSIVTRFKGRTEQSHQLLFNQNKLPVEYGSGKKSIPSIPQSCQNKKLRSKSKNQSFSVNDKDYFQATHCNPRKQNLHSQQKQKRSTTKHFTRHEARVKTQSNQGFQDTNSNNGTEKLTNELKSSEQIKRNTFYRSKFPGNNRLAVQIPNKKDQLSCPVNKFQTKNTPSAKFSLTSKLRQIKNRHFGNLAQEQAHDNCAKTEAN